MTRAVVFLTALMAAASLGLFAQDTSAASPSAASSSTAVAQVNAQSSTGTPAQQGSATKTVSTNAQSTPAAHTSSSSVTTAGPNHAIEGTASNDPATANGQLPQTSTILPLLGLIGLGSLVAGLFARR